MRRIASIWLPALAIERWAKSSDCAPEAVSPALTLSLSKGERSHFDKLNVSAVSPVVLTVEGTHGPVIYAVTSAAAERGARAGARLTDARALDPGLVAMPADPEGDAALLERLAHWAGRWSPLVEVDGANALRLDVTGIAHLFGGERGLVMDIGTRFAAAGLTARIAIAPTATAAWALSHYGKAAAVICGKDTGAKLADLPVAALRLPPEAVRVLERLGLKTISTLAGIERRSLARRFREADNPVDALDRALGRKPEPLTAVPVNPPPRALLKLEEPATHPEAGTQALERLVPRLVKELERRRVGARRLSLTGYRVDGSITVASVATSIPSREPKHLHRLLADKAAALDPEFGFDAFALTAEWTEALGAAQESLVEEPGGERELARLVDRLTVKLGPRAVRRPQPHESHLPERASGWVSALAKAEPVAAPPVQRPPRMLDRPEAIDVIYATPEGMPRRFMWRRAVHDIARVEGPERIAPEWWRERSTARLRDYYRVEDQAGRRYWIYREGLIGDGRGGVPNWFMHGLFG